MSKEMTAEEYKEHFDQGLIPFIRESTKTYGDLRAKEALKEFAEYMISMKHSDGLIHPINIINYCKQKGVEV